MRIMLSSSMSKTGRISKLEPCCGVLPFVILAAILAVSSATLRSNSVSSSPPDTRRAEDGPSKNASTLRRAKVRCLASPRSETPGAAEESELERVNAICLGDLGSIDFALGPLLVVLCRKIQPTKVESRSRSELGRRMASSSSKAKSSKMQSAVSGVFGLPQSSGGEGSAILLEKRICFCRVKWFDCIGEAVALEKTYGNPRSSLGA